MPMPEPCVDCAALTENTCGTCHANVCGNCADEHASEAHPGVPASGSAAAPAPPPTLRATPPPFERSVVAVTESLLSRMNDAVHEKLTAILDAVSGIERRLAALEGGHPALTAVIGELAKVVASKMPGGLAPALGALASEIDGDKKPAETLPGDTGHLGGQV